MGRAAPAPARHHRVSTSCRADFVVVASVQRSSSERAFISLHSASLGCLALVCRWGGRRIQAASNLVFSNGLLVGGPSGQGGSREEGAVPVEQEEGGTRFSHSFVHVLPRAAAACLRSYSESSAEGQGEEASSAGPRGEEPLVRACLELALCWLDSGDLGNGPAHPAAPRPQDPWSGGGVLHNISESVVAVLIPEGAHHLDLMCAEDGNIFGRAWPVLLCGRWTLGFVAGRPLAVALAPAGLGGWSAKERGGEGLGSEALSLP